MQKSKKILIATLSASLLAGYSIALTGCSADKDEFSVAVVTDVTSESYTETGVNPEESTYQPEATTIEKTTITESAIEKTTEKETTIKETETEETAAEETTIEETTEETTEDESTEKATKKETSVKESDKKETTAKETAKTPSENPTSERATTVAPTTVAPTTEAPTVAPTTAAPTTEAPTEPPTTAAPTTEAPTEPPTTAAYPVSMTAEYAPYSEEDAQFFTPADQLTNRMAIGWSDFKVAVTMSDGSIIYPMGIGVDPENGWSPGGFVLAIGNNILEFEYKGLKTTLTLYAKDQAQFQEDKAKEMFDIQNRLRKEKGLKPLKWDADLYERAKKAAKFLGDNGYWNHPNAHGFTEQFRWIHIVGATGNEYDLTVGENLAFGSKMTPADTLANGIANSPGHLEKMFSEYSDIGAIGVYVNSEGDLYCSMLYWDTNQPSYY